RGGTRASRRSSWPRRSLGTSALGRGAVDGRADALVGAAAADVRRHHRVDVLVGRLRLRAEQRRGAHDLAALAVAALGRVLLDPRLLERVQAARAEALDGGDGLRLDLAHGRDARAHGLAVDVHGARAAERHAAAVLRAGEAELLAEHPEERSLG